LQEASSARPLVPVDLLSILKKRFPGLSSEDALVEVTALAAEGLVTVRTQGVSLTQEGLAALLEFPNPQPGFGSDRAMIEQRRRTNASDELNLDQIVELMNSGDRDSEPPRPPELPSRRRAASSVEGQAPGPPPLNLASRNVSALEMRPLAPPEPARSTLPPAHAESHEEEEEELHDDVLQAWRNAARPLDPAEAAAQAAQAAQVAAVQQQQYYGGTPAGWVPQMPPMQLALDPNSPAARLMRCRAEMEILTQEIVASGNLPLEIFAEALQLTGQVQGALEALTRLLIGPV
jgi:hypothetical protein